MSGPAYPRVTPRRSLVMDDDIWADLATLAKLEFGKANASAMLRYLAVAKIHQARQAGILPGKEDA